MSEVKPGLGPNQAFIGVKGSRGKLNTPALLLDLDALEGNIAAMAAHTNAAGIKLRPHSTVATQTATEGSYLLPCSEGNLRLKPRPASRYKRVAEPQYRCNIRLNMSHHAQSAG